MNWRRRKRSQIFVGTLCKKIYKSCQGKEDFLGICFQYDSISILASPVYISLLNSTFSKLLFANFPVLEFQNIVIKIFTYFIIVLIIILTIVAFCHSNKMYHFSKQIKERYFLPFESVKVKYDVLDLKLETSIWSSLQCQHSPLGVVLPPRGLVIALSHGKRRVWSE